MSDILKEYLVSLGVKDNLTDKLGQTLNKASGKLKEFSKSYMKMGAGLAGVFVAANTAVAKFATNLVKSDDELTKYAKSIGKSKEEALKLKSTLDAMGKTMDEINASSELQKVFKKLQQDAEQIKPPDLSEGLTQVREIQAEFSRLKQSGTYAVQWIGHYLFKYIQQPLSKVKEIFGGLNDSVIKNMPKWADKIAQVLSAIVRLGTTVIRGATDIYKGIKRIFDMIPNELKIVGGALTALGLIIKSGPLGILIAIISVVLLLLEDFYTYIDGGESLLGGLWQKLIDIWDLFKDSGALDKLKDNIKSAFEFIKDKFIEAKNYLSELYTKFEESDAINKFKNLLENAKKLFLEIVEPVKRLGGKIIDTFTGVGKEALDWFITTGLPQMIDFVSGVIGFVGDLLAKLNDMGLTEPIILGVVSAFAAMKVVDGITDSVKKLTGFIEGISKAKDAVGHIQGLKDAFSGLKNALGLTKLAQEANNAIMLISAFRAGGLAGAQSALATAEGSATAAQWMLNAAMNANPIALIIIAVIALIAIVVLLVKNWDKVKEFFIGLWNKIKETFSGIGEWFGEKFGAAKERVLQAFASISEWFAEKYEAIKSVFSDIGSWFGEKFQAAKDKVFAVFGTIGDWFKDRAKSIVDKFVNIPKDLKDKFLDAVTKIKEAFSPIVDWFKEKIDAIIGLFTGIGDAIGGAVSWVGDKLFGDKKDTSMQLDGHADGGIFDKHHIAEFAEGNKPEAVIPLTKPSRAKAVLAQAVNYLDGGNDGNFGDLSQKIDGLMQFANTSLTMLNTLSNGLNQNMGLQSANSNVVYNNTYDMKSTYNITDTSGRPESVANAVDRTAQMRLRNLQGVLS